jgi:hypothetical protein
MKTTKLLFAILTAQCLSAAQPAFAEKKLQSVSVAATTGDQAIFDQALVAGTQGQPLRGISLLLSIAKKKNGAVSQDLIDLNLARLYFQLGQLDKALDFYEKVPKRSEFWLEATEEKSHAYGRRRDYDKVIATLETVMAPVFDGAIGPEPFFVESLTYFKICDYVDLFKTDELFKTRFKSRYHELNDLAQKGKSQHVELAIARLDAGSYDLQTIGAEIHFLPRNFTRDEVVKRNMMIRKAALKANNGAGAEQAKNAVMMRIAALARIEVGEIKDTTQKLNILEAEVIERLHMADKNTKNRSTQGDLASSSSEVLTFPVENSGGEMWLDELDSYQARVKGCPQTITSTSSSPKRHL